MKPHPQAREPTYIMRSVRHDSPFTFIQVRASIVACYVWLRTPTRLPIVLFDWTSGQIIDVRTFSFAPVYVLCNLDDLYSVFAC